MEELIDLSKLSEVFNLFGNDDCNLSFVENKVGVKIKKQPHSLKVEGACESVKLAKLMFDLMINFLKYIGDLTVGGVEEIFKFLTTGRFNNLFFDGQICMNCRKEVVLIKNFSQMFYVNSIKRRVITFGVGPAGTGKTYLAVAMAVLALKNRSCEKIIFTRPVLEAGENLGFLPGSLQSKIDPFLKPLYDAMCDFIGVESFNKNLERGTVEVVPLAYMRGRSLNNSFIVLDEAQNTTSKQMKMFLTRLGFNSKMVITGDLTQIDLPRENESGLLEAVKVLSNVEDVAIVEFKKVDVVRNRLVQQILRAYEQKGHQFRKELLV